MPEKTGGLEFRILGTVELLLDGRPVPLRGPVRRGLLAVLLLRANHVVTADKLIEQLWGATPPKTVRPGLQWQISQLRQLMRAEDDPERLAFRSPGYALRVDPDELDLFRFHNLLENGRARLAAGDVAKASKLLESAAQLWRGEAFEDALPPCVVPERERLREIRVAMHEDRIDAGIRLGRHRELLADLGQLVAAFPLRERLRTLQVLALYRSGDLAAAVAAYHRARSAFAEELGMEPGPELQQLFRAVLTRDTELETTPMARAQLASPWHRPAQLPADVWRFTGRKEHLRRLSTLAFPQEGGTAAPAIAITGGVGAGKTGLAVHWLHRVAHRFPDGQLYVNLSGGPPHRASDDPSAAFDVIVQVLQSLGLRRADIPDDIDAAACLYRSLVAGKRAVIMLDDVQSAGQVRPILAGGHTLVVMTTAEHLWGLVAHEGIHKIALGPLEPWEATELLGCVLGRDRVHAEVRAVQELAQLCAYLPLTLRSAAARMQSRGYTSIAEFVASVSRAEDLIDALDVGQDDAGSLRAAFDRSYERLDRAERRLLCQLALAAREPDNSLITPETAAALARISRARASALLMRLASANMITQSRLDGYMLEKLMRSYVAHRASHDDQPHPAQPQKQVSAAEIAQGAEKTRRASYAGRRDGAPLQR